MHLKLKYRGDFGKPIVIREDLMEARRILEATEKRSATSSIDHKNISEERNPVSGISNLDVHDEEHPSYKDLEPTTVNN